MHDETRLPLSEVVRLGIRLAEALRYMHERGITHGDIKPAQGRTGTGMHSVGLWATRTRRSSRQKRES